MLQLKISYNLHFGFDFSIQSQSKYSRFQNIILKIHPFLFALKPFVTLRTSIQLQVDKS
jgi:hypothetical protein